MAGEHAETKPDLSDGVAILDRFALGLLRTLVSDLTQGKGVKKDGAAVALAFDPAIFRGRNPVSGEESGEESGVSSSFWESGVSSSFRGPGIRCQFIFLGRSGNPVSVHLFGYWRPTAGFGLGDRVS